MSLLDCPVALVELYRTVHKRTVWTDVGSVGVGRRSDLGESVAFSQIFSHSHVSQVTGGHTPACGPG